MFSPSLAKKFKEVDKKLAKRAAKKAARAEAERKKKEKQEQIRREKERKEALKEARRQKKEAAKQEKVEQKEQRIAKKLAKKGQQKAMSGKGDSKSDRNATYGYRKPIDTSPVSTSSASVPHFHQSPPCVSPKVPPGSPHFQHVKSLLVHISPDDGLPVISDGFPCVEVPLSTADDVVGMSYRSPSQRQSPVTVQRRSSRSPSPARLVSPPSSLSRVSPPGSRTPHPPSGFSRTEYIPSIGRPTSRRSSKTGALDSSSAEKSRFSRYGGTDINANSRIDPLSKLYGKQSSPAKIPQQTRQQPVRAIHPTTETGSKTYRYSNSRNHSIEDDLIDEVINLQIDDTPGSLSPASTASSRRSSYTMGQRSKGSSSDLRCPPIAGASPQEGASTAKVTRRLSGNMNTDYKPTFASHNRKPSTTTNGPKVPAISRTKAASILDESNSDKTKEEKEAPQPAFSSAQHSVLGTGRTGNVLEGKPRPGGMIGMSNLGNTCYMNSILQCLAQNKDLREYFLEGLHLKDINKRSPRQGSLVKSFAEVVKEIWFPKKKNVVAPTHLQNVFQKVARHFGPGKQQDAQEFLCYLLGELHEEINIAAKHRGKDPEIPDDISEEAKAKLAWDRYCARNNSIFSRLFVGQLKSTLECQTCKNRSVTFDIFWDISVPVPERVKFQRRNSWQREDQPTKHTFDIKDCLNKFTEAEVLDGDNMVTCEKCKKKRVFTKRFSIQRFPKHLVLHLKRFSCLRAKLTTFVDFPLEGLDMSQYLADNAAPIGDFDLTTSINHIGNPNYELFYAIWEQCHAPPVMDVAYMLSLEDSASDDDEQQGGRYNLNGVSQHSGSMIGGHYVAYAKHTLTNKWNCYDDARVEPITEASVPSSFAYVLFYEQTEQLLFRYQYATIRRSNHLLRNMLRCTRHGTERAFV
ncbi:ubiquitin carboxyl-terminal hydrolase 8-like isoform X2 [Patiria miniata]|uniref:Ubiquitin carboxyl-terminal hydrolase n=1 Tax=Patiria miniata TaxID=46514 RepID=A0A914AGM7_PATMI|nr:ubiquitin carboxyl-terminal hydrolase 8-like isoform X2 [Patiria miniata]